MSEVHEKLPIIVFDDEILYPFMIIPLFLADESNIKSANLAAQNNSMVLLTVNKPDFSGSRNFDSFYDIGIIGNIMRKVSMPDGKIKILFQGLAKARITKRISTEPLLADIEIFEEEIPAPKRIEALSSVLKEKIKILANSSNVFSSDALKAIEENDDLSRVSDFILSTIKIKKELAFKFFTEKNLEKKVLNLIDLINGEIEINRLEKDIRSKVHSKIDKNNKEYFLKEQLKEIQRELGNENDRENEIKEYREKFEKKKQFLSEDGKKEIKKQIDKFSRLHPDSADASVVQSYLDWVLEIPFEIVSKEKLSIKQVSHQLNNDHYALTKPKERIEEYFAIRELLEKRGINDKKNNGAILCFYGPPGVGKTSLANSIATALKRKLVRIALGGLEDVNELRGHRRTYVGAMPGRVVQGLINAKQMNPVIVFDEIDKIANSYKGDPTAVLLEILDPEQNHAFRDYYVNFDIDLSEVIFIATANDISQIPAPLRDRMEFIALNSYTPQEKFQIAKNYLLPQELEKHGLKNTEISITKTALKKLIEEYTRESGVRNLRRLIASIFRKSAIKILKNETQKVNITLKNLDEFVEKKVYEIDEVEKKDQIGIVNGLAWTSVGGDVLKIECIKIKGKGNLKLTGQLGDVMKESVVIAFSVIKTLIDDKKIKIPAEICQKDEKGEYLQVYNCYDLHLHVPEGAVPKDGPSAGITMSVAIASILSEKKVRADIAMTGEITLSGKVLAIGGLKEKLIAAHRAKIKEVLIPRKNFEQDLTDLPDEVKKDITLTAVDTIDDVLKKALL